MNCPRILSTTKGRLSGQSSERKPTGRRALSYLKPFKRERERERDGDFNHFLASAKLRKADTKHQGNSKASASLLQPMNTRSLLHQAYTYRRCIPSVLLAQESIILYDLCDIQLSYMREMTKSVRLMESVLFPQSRSIDVGSINNPLDGPGTLHELVSHLQAHQGNCSGVGRPLPRTASAVPMSLRIMSQLTNGRVQREALA